MATGSREAVSAPPATSFSLSACLPACPHRSSLSHSPSLSFVRWQLGARSFPLKYFLPPARGMLEMRIKRGKGGKGGKGEKHPSTVHTLVALRASGSLMLEILWLLGCVRFADILSVAAIFQHWTLLSEPTVLIPCWSAREKTNNRLHPSGYIEMTMLKLATPIWNLVGPLDVAESAQRRIFNYTYRRFIRSRYEGWCCYLSIVNKPPLKRRPGGKRKKEKSTPDSSYNE